MSTGSISSLMFQKMTPEQFNESIKYFGLDKSTESIFKTKQPENPCYAHYQFAKEQKQFIQPGKFLVLSADGFLNRTW